MKEILALMRFYTNSGIKLNRIDATRTKDNITVRACGFSGFRCMHVRMGTKEILYKNETEDIDRAMRDEFCLLAPGTIKTVLMLLRIVINEKMK